MPERRKTDRRTNPAVPEPLERKRERRAGDRRDSVRKKGTFVVKDGGTSYDVAGELGLGGASFVLPRTPIAPTLVIELRVGKTLLLLPAHVTEGPAAHAVVRAVHVRFDELDTATELTLAQWLDDVE
jgi:hypothetical protein